MNPSVRASIRPHICYSVRSSVRQSVCPSVGKCVGTSSRPFVHSSALPSVRSPVRPLVRPNLSFTRPSGGTLVHTSIRYCWIQFHITMTIKNVDSDPESIQTEQWCVRWYKKVSLGRPLPNVQVQGAVCRVFVCTASSHCTIITPTLTKKPVTTANTKVTLTANPYWPLDGATLDRDSALHSTYRPIIDVTGKHSGH